ncbi:MAG: hypothetical protein O7F76_05225 [Planctomycetota bacterium]|nr:hypothetical protein [Planctomycetota bacterium]
MSNLLSRLLLSLILLVGAPVVYCVSYFVLDGSLIRTDELSLLASNGVTSLFIVVAWILIWRRQVVWTAGRRQMTIVAGLLALIPALLVNLIISATSRFVDEVAIVIGGLCWCSVWLALTVFIWRETALERAKRLGEVSESAIACPNCGYNMTGLRQARCPECGTQYTLDELFGMLRERAADLEREQVEAK